MIVTEFYKADDFGRKGQGLGNQLACYITTRVIAADKGYQFGIINSQEFKGADFLTVDFGIEVKGITQYYKEKEIIHPENGADIRIYDKDLVNVIDNTKIEGYMQDEQYFIHRKDEIREWLKVKPEWECYDYAEENTCVINFRGGPYAYHPEFFLNKNIGKMQ